MKTEPTEKEKIIKGLEIKIRNCDDGLDEVSWAYEEGILISKRDAINLVELLKYSPKIKQLEWTFAKNEGFAFTPFVNYRIYYWKTAYNENKVQLIYNKNSNAALNGHDGHELIGEYDDCDSAIRAAQTDFEKRVKECLE